MAETQTPDIAAQHKPYEEALKNYFQLQAQPQSFLEHPATRAIPIIGPILGMFGQVSRQKRLLEAGQNAGLFQTLVKEGDLTPELIAKTPTLQRIPQPIIDAGLLEAQKTRSTLGYQYRQAFKGFVGEQTPYASESYLPSLNEPTDGTPGYGSQAETVRTGMSADARAEALRTWLRKNPEGAAALGVPEAGRIALEAQTQDIGLPYFKSILGGGPTPPGVSAPRAGQQGGIPPTATPLPPPTFDFSDLPAGANDQLSQIYQDYAQKKYTLRQLATELTKVPGMTPERIQELVEAFPQTVQEQQRGSQPSAQPPLGQFNPNTPGLPSKITIGFSGGKFNMQAETLPLPDRAAAYVLHHTLQNPQNFTAALQDITSKGVILSPDQLKSIQGQAIAPTLTRNYARNLASGLDPTQAGARAALDTAQQFNITDPAQAEALTKLLQNPAVVSNLIAEAQRRGAIQADISPQGDILRQKEVTQAGARTAEEFNKKVQAYVNTPLGALPNGEGLNVAKAFRTTETGKTITQLLEEGKKILPDELTKSHIATQRAVTYLEYLKELYQRTKPLDQQPALAKIRGYFQSLGASLGANEPIRNYEEARDVFITRMKEIFPEDSIARSPEYIQRAIKNLPEHGRVTEEGLRKFDDLISQIQEPFSILRQLYTDQSTGIPTIKHQSESPDVDKQLQQLKKKGK